MGKTNKMATSRVFENVKGVRPGKSVFNLSYSKLFTTDMGKLIPVMCDEVVPGDVFQIGNEIVVRTLPLVAPILHEIYITTHYFFVPFRIMGEHPNIAFDWVAFITGGADGNDVSEQPIWNVVDNSVGSLWDYLGFPIGIDAAGARPVLWPKVAYNMIWNEYYRDQNLDTELTVNVPEIIQFARYEKDYLTSALPWQQRGTSPAIAGNVTGIDQDIEMGSEVDATARALRVDNADGKVLLTGYAAAASDARWSDPSLEVTGFDISDLRLSLNIQRWQELNARAGIRYKEFILAHYGERLPDSRVQRPEYLGGSKGNLITSEVLQTSETSGVSPQGHLVGHGISVQKNFCAKVRIQEFGLIMGIMCIRPRTMYHQGLDRQWTRATRYEFYTPEFAGLSEQAILEREVYASATEAHNLTVFGYQGRFDEMRIKRNYVCGDMHTDYDHWHCCRQFAGRPTLNSTFVECDPRKDIFAAPAEDGFIVSFGNQIKAIRPMPVIARPGGL